MIEMKRLNSGLYLKDGSLSSNKHVQEQNQMHKKLRENGWQVEFAEGMDGAKIKFEEYLMK
jgi:DNA-dependent RNA polymerase auxiliary subunit epsilon